MPGSITRIKERLQMNKETWEELSSSLPVWLEESRAHTDSGKTASLYTGIVQGRSPIAGHPYRGNRSGTTLSAGESDIRFTMQSISKVFTLILALMDNGEEAVFSKVGMEPTGDNFNSMLKLELVQPGIPFNPLINAGAIVISSMIGGSTPEEKSHRILNFIRDLAGAPELDVDEQTLSLGVRRPASSNRSMAYFLTDNGVLRGGVEDVLDVYFRHCSISVTCAHLSRMALVLASGGSDPVTGRILIPRRYVQIAKTFMVTCGMYNGSGTIRHRRSACRLNPASQEASLRIVPGGAGIGIVGPSLNGHGNSVAGVHLLRTLSRQFNWSMF